MKLLKLMTMLILLASFCFSSQVSTYGQKTAQIEFGRLSELKGRRSVFVAATESLLQNNIRRLVEKGDLFQLVQNQRQAEFFLEGIRSGESESTFGDGVFSISTTLQASYMRADGVKVIVWSKSVTSKIHWSSPGGSLWKDNTQDEVYLMNSFVKEFKIEMRR